MKRILAILMVTVLMLTTAAYAATNVREYTKMDDSSDKRHSNIAIAADKIDGVTVPAGGSFSFNAVVGPRTEDRGYLEAPNGRGVYVIGGGVSQVASTLYLALLELQSGIEFDEIDTYGSGEFEGDYVADRNFAIVTDYADGDDFVFINRFNTALTINMWVDGSRLYCKITTSGSEDLSLEASASDWNSKTRPEGTTMLGTSRIKLSSKTTSRAMTKNITRAASELHNVTIENGQVFSFNDIVGPRTQRYGYINAKNGRGSFNVGGGVSQVASALWLAIKEVEGIYIVEMDTYGEDYNQSYVDSSADAILTDYKSDKDFSFRNETGKPINIAMFIEDENIYCRVYQ